MKALKKVLRPALALIYWLVSIYVTSLLFTPNKECLVELSLLSLISCISIVTLIISKNKLTLSVSGVIFIYSYHYLAKIISGNSDFSISFFSILNAFFIVGLITGAKR